MMRAALLAGLVGAALLLASPARAEYRAYQLQVVNLYDCRVNKMKTCPSQKLTTAFGPRQYVATHGGSFHIGVVMLATWMCYGDTSDYKAVCPRPAAHKPKFKVGDDVVITLQKHITEGWHGKVEVAYYQASVASNVYGVRFPGRRDVYARYYEKDLKLAAPGAGAGSKASADVTGKGGANAQASTASPAATQSAADGAAAGIDTADADTAAPTTTPLGTTTPKTNAVYNGLTAQPTTTVSPSPTGQAPGSGGIAAVPPLLSAPPQ